MFVNKNMRSCNFISNFSFHLILKVLLMFLQDLSACPDGQERKGGCSIKHFCFALSQKCIKGDCCKKVDSKELANGQRLNGMNFGLDYARNFGMGGSGFGMALPCYDFQPQCLLFSNYCSLISIAEVCMRSCGFCAGLSLGGGIPNFGSANIGLGGFGASARNLNLGAGLVSQGMLGRGSGDMAVYSLMGRGSMTPDSLQYRTELRAVNQAELGSQEGVYYPDGQK